MMALDSIMGVWIIASVISASPEVQNAENKQTLGSIVTFSQTETIFSKTACNKPKYELHAKDQDADDHMKITCLDHAELVFPNLYSIDEQHIRAKIEGINYEFYRYNQKQENERFLWSLFRYKRKRAGSMIALLDRRLSALLRHRRVFRREATC